MVAAWGSNTQGQSMVPGSLLEEGVTTAIGAGHHYSVALLEITKSPIEGDLDGDGCVGAGDLGMLLAAWGALEDPADLDGDGEVAASDLGVLLANWAGCG